ncbi:MAG TPA: polysaccharide deacetylase family protein [Stellaceae bacterium]|nr:polysaccharide deacetylase family protein [Stellaceae bacterium]
MRASLSTHLARKLGHFILTRPQNVTWPGGVVSFTFDDFPKSALDTGGRILEAHGVRGTYYTAIGLAETYGNLGRMFDRGDVDAAHRGGHEIACHTFHHLDCGRNQTRALLPDIDENAAAISELTHGYTPTNFAFPFGGISLSSKSALSRRFESCRGIGFGINAGISDFADLRANRVRECADDQSYRRLVDEARTSDGWLIFYTHDVVESPSPYGCTPKQLDQVVAYAAASCPVLTVRDVITGLASPAPAIF